MLLKSKSTEIQANAAEALRCIAGISEGNCYLVVGPSASSVETMIYLLGSTSSSVQRSVAGQLLASYLCSQQVLQDQRICSLFRTALVKYAIEFKLKPFLGANTKLLTLYYAFTQALLAKLVTKQC